MLDVDIDLVVVNYHTYDLLNKFLDSYFEYKPTRNSTLTVVDVDSDSFLMNKLVSSFKNDITFIPTLENIGYSGACNLAASITSGRNIAFFNSDTRFINNTCVDYCVNYLDSHNNVAVVGPLQYDSNGSCTHGGIFGKLSRPEMRGWRSMAIDSFRDNRIAVSVSGSAYFVKRNIWNEMHECDKYRYLYPDVDGAFLPTKHYYEETAFSYHCQDHGYEVWYLGEAEMIHEWHKSSPVGGPVDKNMREAKKMFVDFCNYHNIEHD